MKPAKNPAVEVPVVVVDGDSLEDGVGVVAAAAGATSVRSRKYLHIVARL